MKKIIFAMTAILVILFVILSVLGSGVEYPAEKLFYRATKTNSRIAANPDVAPPALLSSVEADLQKLIRKYPTANITKMANMALAEFYTVHRNHDKALSAIASIMSLYSDDALIMSTAQFLKGSVYERQNRWDKALAEFTILRDKYPDTQLGIQIPLYIAKYYELKGKDAEAKNAYSDAQAFYEKTEKKYSGRSLGYVASNMLTQAFINARNYERAGENIEFTINKYASDMAFVQVLPSVDFIYIQKLNRPDKAVGIYKSMLSKTRDIRLIKFLNQKIEKLEIKK